MATPDEDGFIAVESRRKATRDPEPTGEGPPSQEAVMAKETAPNQDGTLKNRHTLRLRVEYPYSSGNSGINVWSNAQRILAQLHKADSTLTLIPKDTLIDPVTSLAKIAKSLQTFTKLFTHETQHLANQGKRHCIFMTVSTALPYFRLRFETGLDWLKSERIWLNLHEFATNDISTIGLFVNVRPALTWRKDFTQKVQQSISSVYSTLALGSAPALQIRPNTIAYGKRGEKREITSVLEIQCNKVHSQQLKDALMSEDFLLASHLDFIPTGYAQATSPPGQHQRDATTRSIPAKHSQRSHHGTPQGTGRFPSNRGRHKPPAPSPDDQLHQPSGVIY